MDFYRIHSFADGIGVLYRRSTHVFTGWLHGYLMWVAEMWFDALVVDCLWFCHSKKMVIPGTEDMVDAYHDYWHHIKYAVIGMFTQAVIALPVGLFVMLLGK